MINVLGKLLLILIPTRLFISMIKFKLLKEMKEQIHKYRKQ